MNEEYDEIEPCEDDCFITPCGHLGSQLSVSIGGRHLGEYTEYRDAELAIVTWIHENNWSPDIWFVDDHGGVSPYRIEDVRWCEECDRIEEK